MLAYQCEKQLKELGDKISGDKKKSVEDAIAAVRDAINRNDTDAMKRTYDELQNKFQEVSAELYKQASAGAGAQAGPQPGPEAGARPGAEQGAGKRGEGDVVDAEFEVVDEDKKK
jgi:molecular chaperone DnaK